MMAKDGASGTSLKEGALVDGRVWIENPLAIGAEAAGAESSESFLLLDGVLRDQPRPWGSILIITIFIIVVIIK